MVILLQLITVIVNANICFLTLVNLKKRLKTIYFVILIFQVIFVVPIISEWIFGVQDYSYKSPGFDEALNDTTTNILYCIFGMFVPILLYVFERKNTSNNGVQLTDIKDTLSNIKINRSLYFLCVILMFLPGILIFFSPSPEKYLTEYAYFQKYSHFATDSELWFHRNILRIGGFISLLAIVVTKFFSKNTFMNNLIIYIAAFITGILNGKRTLFAFIVLGITIAEILRSPKGKFPYRRTIFSATLIITFFITYAFLLDKHTLNVSTLDNIRLYFFRDVDVKFAIYALLNPERYKILEFWGQSYLFNFFFFIPRDLWDNKPYPYDIYLTATALGYPSSTVLPWNFQTSFFGEALSNLGWFGIPISLVLIIMFIKISERSKNPLIILMCMFIIVFSFMNHFGAFKNYFIIWFILLVYNKLKKKRKNNNHLNFERG